MCVCVCVLSLNITGILISISPSDQCHCLVECNWLYFHGNLVTTELPWLRMSSSPKLNYASWLTSSISSEFLNSLTSSWLILFPSPESKRETFFILSSLCLIYWWNEYKWAANVTDLRLKWLMYKMLVYWVCRRLQSNLRLGLWTRTAKWHKQSSSQAHIAPETPTSFHVAGHCVHSFVDIVGPGTSLVE